MNALERAIGIAAETHAGHTDKKGFSLDHLNPERLARLKDASRTEQY